MTLDEVKAEIEWWGAVAEKRRSQAKDESIRGLRPAGTDWLTDEEIDRLCELQAEYARMQPTLEEIRECVRRKRARRLAGLPPEE